MPDLTEQGSERKTRVSDLLCISPICMNTTKDFVPLHNDSKYANLHPIHVYAQNEIRKK